VTLESPPFCPHCGEPLSPNVDFCPRCGKDVLAPAAPPPTTQEVPVTVLDEPPAAETEVVDGGPAARPSGRRTALLAVGAVAVVAIAGTAWSLLHGEDGDAFWADRLAQPSAVTSAPELAWTWEGSSVATVALAGPTTYVAADDGIHAFDEQGDEEWSSHASSSTWVFAPSGAVDYVLAYDYQGSTLTALDADDGSTRWSTNGDVVDAVGDRVLMRTSDGILALDARTGDERWTADAASGAALGPGAVYVVDDGRLRRLDLDDGSEVWATDLDPESTSSGFGAITVVDGLVVAAGTGRAQAFDTDAGAPRWSVEIDVPADAFGPPVGLASRSTVWVWGEEDGHAVIRDEGGRTGTVAADDASGFYAYGVHGADGDYLVTGDGLVLDDHLEVVGAAHRSPGAYSREGIYELASGTLSFSPFTATEPTWQLEIGGSDRRYVESGDGRVVVVGTDDVAVYR
jgi:hypothetical protein